MSASVFEQILARASAVLAAAGLAVERGRLDALGVDDLPAVNVKRGDVSLDVLGEAGARGVLVFAVEHHLSVANGWEAAADALHMVSHAALLADAPLAALGRGLRCTSIDVEADAAEREFATLTARYQMQVSVRPGDLTRPIN